MGRQRPIGKVLEDAAKRKHYNTVNPKSTAHLFKPGEVANPAGRPIGSRQKISESFLKNMYTAWENLGMSAILEMAHENPVQFVQCVAGLLPKQLEITQEHIYEIRDTPMNADEWQKSCIIEHEPEIIPESDSVN